MQCVNQVCLDKVVFQTPLNMQLPSCHHWTQWQHCEKCDNRTPCYWAEKNNKSSCFPSSLSDQKAEKLHLSWWWIRLQVHNWQVLLWTSCSPVGSLQMQIPSATVFYDNCSCFPGRPQQVSRRGLANQDRERGMGGQVGPLSCHCGPLSTLTASHPLLCPPDHSSAICAPIIHFHSPIPLSLLLSQS